MRVLVDLLGQVAALQAARIGKDKLVGDCVLEGHVERPVDMTYSSGREVVAAWAHAGGERADEPPDVSRPDFVEPEIPDVGRDMDSQPTPLVVGARNPSALPIGDELPNSDAKDRAFEIFKKVSQPGLAAAIGAVGDPADFDKAHYVRFDPRSQALFENWYQKLILGVRSGEDHPAICSHRVKYSSTMPALALLFHAIAVADSTASAGPVSVGATALAIRWIDYLEIHARRLYSAFTRRREIAGALLGAKIKAGKVPSPFRVRGDVLLKGWAGLTELDDVNLAIEELVAAGWIRPRDIPTTQQGGRPTVEYLVNPKVQACSVSRTPGEDDA